MLPIQICRHWQVKWLGPRDCQCQGCGKLGHWFDGMVLWQRRPITCRDDRPRWEFNQRDEWPANFTACHEPNHQLSEACQHHETARSPRMPIESVA